MASHKSSQGSRSKNLTSFEARLVRAQRVDDFAEEEHSNGGASSDEAMSSGLEDKEDEDFSSDLEDSVGILSYCCVSIE